jgi:hypothetical protein
VQERIEGRVDKIKAWYMNIWKWHSEMHFVQSICANNKKYFNISEIGVSQLTIIVTLKDHCWLVMKKLNGMQCMSLGKAIILLSLQNHTWGTHTVVTTCIEFNFKIAPKFFTMIWYWNEKLHIYVKKTWK